ncbi:YybH family protein [Sinimarinibacterium thermocellulolyticum]|uniref:Nuclear transport factor 2 family protein n=1 Tax=Sinimarinibacterium thermocellulolyticum TaxID=3170016 RepID=A0ABV2A5L2_9GAMM
MLAFAAALVVAGTRAQSANDDAVKAVVDDFHRALVQRDRDTALKLLMPNAVIFETGYVEASREQYAAGHLDADMLYAATVQRQVVHRESAVSGDMALVITQARHTGEFQGEPVNLTNTETMVLRRSAGTWKILHIHWSGHEPAGPAAVP